MLNFSIIINFWVLLYHLSKYALSFLLLTKSFSLSWTSFNSHLSSHILKYLLNNSYFLFCFKLSKISLNSFIFFQWSKALFFLAFSTKKSFIFLLSAISLHLSKYFFNFFLFINSKNSLKNLSLSQASFNFFKYIFFFNIFIFSKISVDSLYIFHFSNAFLKSCLSFFSLAFLIFFRFLINLLCFSLLLLVVYLIHLI